jgi:hypothetical protein
MKKTNFAVAFTLCTLLTAAFHPVCLAQSAPSEQPAATEEPTTITVRSVGPLAPVAPAWQPDRTYKFGDFVSYDGIAYKAKTGSAHRRPDPATEIGWEKMNACDDKSKGAVKCEIGNQVGAVSVDEKDRKRDDNIRGIEFNSQSSLHN